MRCKGNNTMPLGRDRHADAEWQTAELRGGWGKKKSCLRKRTGAGLASSDAPRRGDTVGVLFLPAETEVGQFHAAEG